MEKSTGTPDYKRIAVEIIQREHRTLASVLELLERLLRDVIARHSEPDFHLLSMALYYIEEYPCRLHHPKEAQYLFPAVRRESREFDGVLVQLESEHVHEDAAVRELYRLLVLFQAGAPGALDDLSTAVRHHAAGLYEHMRKEEALLADPRLCIPSAAWRTIADAFVANDDPLFGEERRRHFALLHHRIVNLLPGKIRRALVGSPDAATGAREPPSPSPSPSATDVDPS